MANASSGETYYKNQLARSRASDRKNKKNSVDEAQETVTRSFSARALAFSWTNLITTLGATLLYIIFHFFMAHILQNEKFCKFGSEWFPALSKDKKQNIVEGALGMMEIMLMFIVLSFLGLIIYAAYYFLTTSWLDIFIDIIKIQGNDPIGVITGN